MGLGKRILDLRERAGVTQKELSESTGLAVSYLSRIENGHVMPSVPTLGRIADAFGEPINVFFLEEPDLHSPGHCPVSAKGVCIIDQLKVARGIRPKPARRGYTLKQLELLRICDLLIHTDDSRLLDSLETVLRSFLALARTGPEGKPGAGRGDLAGNQV